MLSRYRKHSFLIIMLVAAIITPPDLMTLILVTIPLYLLYEISIRVTRWVERWIYSSSLTHNVLNIGHTSICGIGVNFAKSHYRSSVISKQKCKYVYYSERKSASLFSLQWISMQPCVPLLLFRPLSTAFEYYVLTYY